MAWGVLLPGFGPQLSLLPQARWEDWKQAVIGEMQLLRALYSGVLLVGFSLGGAICLAAAAEENPDGLVLLAPFTRTGSDLKRTRGPLCPKPTWQTPGRSRPISPAWYRVAQEVVSFTEDLRLPEVHLGHG